MKKNFCLYIALLLIALTLVACAKAAPGKEPEGELNASVDEAAEEKTTAPVSGEKESALNYSWKDYAEFCGKLLAGEKSTAQFSAGAALCYVKEENGKMCVFEKEHGGGMRLEAALDLCLPEDAEDPYDEGYYWGFFSEYALMLIVHTGSGEEDCNLSVWCAEENGGWSPVKIPAEMASRMATGGAFIDENVGFIAFDTQAYPKTPDEAYDSRVYATFDGGKSWVRPDGLSIPEELAAELQTPVFLTPVFDGRHGVMPVSVFSDLRSGGKSCMVWFETDDGGATWSFRDRADRD